MGLFDFLKKKERNNDVSYERAFLSESEKKYYQPDEYYTKKVNIGTSFERTVVTFDDRKKTAIPSKRGLYPAEILLLAYCDKGDYPCPKKGYPGFWWFEYGIRDVGTKMLELENRGFLKLGIISDAVKSLTTSQLKDLLSAEGVSMTGNKEDLINKVIDCVSEDKLITFGLKRKYVLTSIGQAELEENAYVPYMHKLSTKTTENVGSGVAFNMWSINKLLGCGSKSNWKDIVIKQEQLMMKNCMDKHEKKMNDLKNTNTEWYEVLKAQDEQIAAVQKADAKYIEDKDILSYIQFWEKLWANGGLKFEGDFWHFKLPDLYIKAKRYDDALRFVINLAKAKPMYADKSIKYIEKIERMKSKKRK